MNYAKKIPVSINEQELNISFETILPQKNDNRKQAEEEIYRICKHGSLEDLIHLRMEVVSEITSNKFYLKRIDDAIEKALRGDFNV